jgi:hypothetical protein
MQERRRERDGTVEAVSEHARYRGWLEQLAANEFADTVARVARERGWVAAEDVTAHRTFGRFEPGAAPWATLLYALGTTYVRVDAFEDDGDPLRFSRVEHDPAVAGLDAFLRAHPHAVIVRYRPGQRCVVRVGDRFVKLVRPELGTRLHDAGRQLWNARTAGHVPFRVAEPDRWDVGQQALWQGVVAGEPVGPRLASGRGRPIAELVGAALGALATAPVEPWQKWSAEDQRGRIERAGAQIVRRVPELRDQVADVLDRRGRMHECFVARAPVPVHGAPAPDQWLDDGSTLGLVDFDRFSWSDPELDSATFLGSLDFDRRSRASLDELEKALLDGLRDAGFVPDPRRWAAYRVDIRLRKVARTAMAIRPDGDERAARHLELVLDALTVAEGRPTF